MEVRKSILKRALNSFRAKHFNGLPDGSRIISSSGSEVKFTIRETFLNFLFGAGSAAKAQMKTFRESPLVFMVVDKIASTSASLERIAVDENGEPIEKSVLLEFLENPNTKQSQSEFYESGNQSLLMAGNLFFYMIDGIGAGVEVIVWRPGYVEIFTDSAGEVTKYEYTELSGRITTVDDPDKVLHIRTSNITQDEESLAEWGVSPIEALWSVIRGSNEKFSASASIFKNRGIIGILTNKSEAPMLPKERLRLQNEFDEEAGGSDKFNKIKIATSDLSYIQTGMSPTDLKLLDGIVADLRIICAAYGLQSVLFNDTQSSTFDNMNTAKRAAYTDSYLPLSNHIDSKLSPWLSDALNVNETIMVDRTSIEELRNTANDLMNRINSLDSGVSRKAIEALSINNVLEMLGLDKIGTEGDARLGPGTKTTTNAED